MGTITLNSVTNCIEPYGTSVTISGFNAADVIVLKEVGTGSNLAWNAWPNVTCTIASGCVNNGTNRGYLNIFLVNGNGGYGTNFVYPTAQNAADAWQAAFPSGIEITGATSYSFAIGDNNPTDNSGGLVIEYSVKPSNAIMFSCNT